MKGDIKSALSEAAFHCRNGLTKSEVFDILTQIDKENRFSKSYKRVAILKSIVNNKTRTLLGEIADIFYERNALLYPYKGEPDIPVYHFDRDAAMANQEASKDKRAKMRVDFLGEYDGNSKSHFAKQESDILIIVNCCKEKSDDEGEVLCSRRYQSRSFQILNKIRNLFIDADLYILSAKYGLIPETEKIPYYDLSFNSLQKIDVRRICPDLHIREQLDYLLEHTSYKVVIFILGDQYLQTLDLQRPIDLKDSFLVYFSLDKNDATKNELKVKGESFEIRLQTKKFVKKFKNYITNYIKEGFLCEFFRDYEQEAFLENPSKCLKEFISKID